MVGLRGLEPPTSPLSGDEKAGLQRDAIRSQCSDVLEAQEKETGDEED